MFKNLGKIEYKKKINQIKLDSFNFKKGLNLTDEFIIFKDNQISIYDRICDHNSGKLITKNNKTFVLCIIGNLFLKKENILMVWSKRKKNSKLLETKY